MRQFFNFTGADYMLSQEINTFREVCEITIINQGDDPFLVNGLYFKPYPPGHPELVGSVFNLTCNENEQFAGRLTLVFEGAGSAPRCTIIQRYYVIQER